MWSSKMIAIVRNNIYCISRRCPFFCQLPPKVKQWQIINILTTKSENVLSPKVPKAPEVPYEAIQEIPGGQICSREKALWQEAADYLTSLTIRDFEKLVYRVQGFRDLKLGCLAPLSPSWPRNTNRILGGFRWSLSSKNLKKCEWILN